MSTRCGGRWRVARKDGSSDPPPPTINQTILGLSTPTPFTVWRDFTATNGRPPYRRSFDTGAPTWAGHTAHNDDVAAPTGTGALKSLASFKPVVADVLSGSLDSYFNQLAIDAKDGTYFMFWHEPENNLTQADYKAIYNRILPIMKAADASHKYITCLTIGAFEGGKDGTTWFPTGAGAPDFISVDVYNGYSPTNGRPWKELQARVESTFLAQVVPTGIPYGITEFGTRADPGNVNRRATWLTNAWTFLKSSNFKFACYWSENDYALDGDSQTLAAWTTIVNDPDNI